MEQETSWRYKFSRAPVSRAGQCRAKTRAFFSPSLYTHRRPLKTIKRFGNQNKRIYVTLCDSRSINLVRPFARSLRADGRGRDTREMRRLCPWKIDTHPGHVRVHFVYFWCALEIKIDIRKTAVRPQGDRRTRWTTSESLILGRVALNARPKFLASNFKLIAFL